MRYILAQLHPQSVPTDDVPDIDRIIPDGGGHADTPTPRLIKTHSLYNPYFTKAIYLLRNGRACTYSNYRLSVAGRRRTRSFLEYLQAPSGSVEAALRQEAQWPSRWQEHVVSWLEQDYVPLLVVRYEQLQRDPRAQVRRMLDFLGWTADEGRIGAAIKKASRRRMRAAEAAGLVNLNRVAREQDSSSAYTYSAEEEACFMGYSRKALFLAGYE